MKISALTVNGSGPATGWLHAFTFESDLDETVVPDPPSSLRAKASDDSIAIMWKPPASNKILVRGYTIGWGKGIPDEYTKVVDNKQRYFVIEDLSKFHLNFYELHYRRMYLGIILQMDDTTSIQFSSHKSVLSMK